MDPEDQATTKKVSDQQGKAGVVVSSPEFGWNPMPASRGR